MVDRGHSHCGWKASWMLAFGRSISPCCAESCAVSGERGAQGGPRMRESGPRCMRLRFGCQSVVVGHRGAVSRARPRAPMPPNSMRPLHRSKRIALGIFPFTDNTLSSISAPWPKLGRSNST